MIVAPELSLSSASAARTIVAHRANSSVTQNENLKKKGIRNDYIGIGQICRREQNQVWYASAPSLAKVTPMARSSVHVLCSFVVACLASAQSLVRVPPGHYEVSDQITTLKVR